MRIARNGPNRPNEVMSLPKSNHAGGPFAVEKVE